MLCIKSRLRYRVCRWLGWWDPSSWPCLLGCSSPSASCRMQQEVPPQSNTTSTSTSNQQIQLSKTFSVVRLQIINQWWSVVSEGTVSLLCFYSSHTTVFCSLKDDMCYCFAQSLYGTSSWNSTLGAFHHVFLPQTSYRVLHHIFPSGRTS